VGFFFFVRLLRDRIDIGVIMLPTFETVLEQAKALSAADRKRLAAVLSQTSARSNTSKNGTDDDAVIAALRAKVDAMEKSENLKPNSSARVAERIRKWNDRGYKL